MNAKFEQSKLSINFNYQCFADFAFSLEPLRLNYSYLPG